MRTNVRSPSEAGGRPGFLLGKASLTLLLAVALMMTLGVRSASADTTSFDLGVGNSAISGYTGPYAHVNVNLTDSTHATITFTSLTNNGNIYLLAGAQAVDVNVNAASWTLGSITGSNAGTGGFTPGPYSNGGSNNADGFGSFNQTIDSFDGYTHSSDTISFVLTNTGGTWASATNVLAANASGFLAAAHIFVTSSPANTSNGALATGFAANGASNPVPEPATLALALSGVGLIGLGGVRRLLRRKA